MLDHAFHPRPRCRKTVLVVEDDPDQAAAVCALLEHPAVETVVATNGVEGITRARELRPALVVLDVHLPGMDGFQVFEVLRRELERASLRVIFVSGHAVMGALAMAKELGAFASFQKPFSPRAFKKRLFEALEIVLDPDDSLAATPGAAPLCRRPRRDLPAADDPGDRTPFAGLPMPPR